MRNKAVKDTVDKFLKSLEKTNTASPRIEGEIPNVSKYIRTFTNIDLAWAAQGNP